MAKGPYDKPINKTRSAAFGSAKHHYGSKGEKLGHSRENFIGGGRTYYGRDGSYVGSTRKDGRLK